MRELHNNVTELQESKDLVGNLNEQIRVLTTLHKTGKNSQNKLEQELSNTNKALR